MRFLFKGNWRIKLNLGSIDLQWGSKHLSNPGETYNSCLGEEEHKSCIEIQQHISLPIGSQERLVLRPHLAALYSLLPLLR